MNQATNKEQLHVFEGTVLSTAMAKTIVVRVSRTKIHPKYKKRFQRTRNFKVHDETGAFQVGDQVRFVATRPLSRHKRWQALTKSKKAV